MNTSASLNTSVPQLNSTLGYLIAALWKQVEAFIKADPAAFDAWKEREYQTESALMAEIVVTASEADKLITELVDWDEYCDMFDYEFICLELTDNQSLNAALWPVIFEKSSLKKAVTDWVKATGLPAH